MTADAYVVREDCSITTEGGHSHVESQVIGIYRSAKTARKVAHLYALEHVCPRAASEDREAVVGIQRDGRSMQWTVEWGNHHTTVLASKHTVTDRFNERRMPAPLGLTASNPGWMSDVDEVDDTESEVSDGDEEDADYGEWDVSDDTVESDDEGMEGNTDDAVDGDYNPGDVHR